MQLEKVLEEIDVKIAGSMGKKREGLLEARDIIRKHLSSENAAEIARSSRDNDGWIPVEERLPEKDGFYIATIDGEIIGEDDPFVGLAEFDRGDWYDNEDYTRVIAWRPLPDPYRPERSTE